jgi:hypothetical protein
MHLGRRHERRTRETNGDAAQWQQRSRKAMPEAETFCENYGLALWFLFGKKANQSFVATVLSGKFLEESPHAVSEGVFL